MKAQASTPKADETRLRILRAALELFRSHGFERTTMREIAGEAGVATGAAYYYFDSKEAMVMAFYELAQQEMAPRMAEALAAPGNLEARLRALIDVKLQYFEPSRAFLGALLGHAADPHHPLSPFSQETRAIRDADIECFARALEHGDTRVHKDLAPHLPRLLWLYQMGLIFFWLTDRSAGQSLTARLIDRSLHLAVVLIKLAGLPLMRPLRKTVVELIEIAQEAA
jgi:AcrR family transcriptional regulator